MSVIVGAVSIIGILIAVFIAVLVLAFLLLLRGLYQESRTHRDSDLVDRELMRRRRRW